LMLYQTDTAYFVVCFSYNKRIIVYLQCRYTKRYTKYKHN
jgi:hypothetical protein